MTRRRLWLERAALVGAGGVLVAFLVAPLVALLAKTPLVDLLAGLEHPLVWPALRLSLLTTLASLVLTVLFGVPLAWSLSQAKGRSARAIESLVQLPIVIPPAVAGVAMLFAFGRRGLFTSWLSAGGFALPFTTAAVVVAQVFVSAPFLVQAALSAFRRVDSRSLLVARSLGASPLRVLWKIALPLARPGLVAGAAMCWARSLGEFGATLMFAGNLQGKTQTLPLAIYTALESDIRAAQALSIVLVIVAAVLLLAVHLASRDAAQTGETR